MATNHALELGMLLGNLHSLEALLRVYSLKTAQKQRPPAAASSSYWSLRVGDVVPEDEFTNYDSLGPLVRKFNDDVSSRDAGLAIDQSVVDLRDLLAHGRVAGEVEDTASLRIVKFSRPTAGKVTVVASQALDDAWFAHAVPFVRDQIVKVAQALERYAA